MSRIAKNPVVVPPGVEVALSTGQVSVKGPLGTLTRAVPGEVEIERIEDRLQFKATSRSIHSRAMSGTMRALVANMVHGVTKGFERKLSLVGVGYRAQAQGDKVNLTLGFSHPVVHAVPKGVKVETPTQTEILVKGADKQQVGLVAAQIRAYREPDAYKGKGLRYSDEVVVLKETKKK
jgi:large subunit ribosomal protein L6